VYNHDKFVVNIKGEGGKEEYERYILKEVIPKYNIYNHPAIEYFQ